MSLSRTERSLFVFAIAFSAFLVFLIQPMVGKRLLPWFGGAPAVWSVCLAFYQTTLFAGYAYAHGLMRLGRPRLELGVHAGLFVLALSVLPVLPDAAARPEAGSDATLGILAALLVHVALPFLFLAATGPLVQAWFARSHPQQNPYFLYAFSNAGSLLALLAYPFALEPRFGLIESGGHWGLAFAVVGASILACGGAAALRTPAGPGVRPSEAAETGEEDGAIETSDVAWWCAFSGVAVVLLMGITNQLCLDIASVPFLWILPLAIYLLSFIVCFSTPRLYRRGPFVAVAGIAMLLLPYADTAFVEADSLLAGLQARPFAIELYSVLLFATCMVAHGELYRRRPAPRSLTAFYLSISAGGAIGGLIVGIGANRILNDYYEVPLGLALWLGLVLALALREPTGPLRPDSPLWRKLLACSVGAAVVLSLLSGERYRWSGVVHQERGFFGVLRVIASEDGALPAHQLRHGTTLHGFQYRGRLQQAFPTTYYGFASGIGLALPQLGASGPLRVGVVGLGAGTLSAYGRPGDFFRYYEIDPAVISLAGDPGLFTFLRNGLARTEIVEADGRIALEAERDRAEPGWDLLVLDAFSSDAVPMHLLTREAFALYAERIGSDGVLAIHVSNRQLDLSGVCLRLAEATGLSAAMVRTASAPRHNSAPARWVFATRRPERLDRLHRAMGDARRALRLSERHVEVTTRDPASASPLWTDDYSDLLGVLRR